MDERVAPGSAIVSSDPARTLASKSPTPNEDPRAATDAGDKVRRVGDVVCANRIVVEGLLAAIPADAANTIAIGSRSRGGSAAFAPPKRLARSLGKPAAAAPATDPESQQPIAPRPAGLSFERLFAPQIGDGYGACRLRGPDGRFGLLRVPQRDLEGVRALLATTCERYPLMLDLLYALQSTADRSFTLTLNDELDCSFDRATGDIATDPRAMFRARDGTMLLSPAMLLVHTCARALGARSTGTAVAGDASAGMLSALSPASNFFCASFAPTTDAHGTTPFFRGTGADGVEIGIGAGQAIRGHIRAVEHDACELRRPDGTIVTLALGQLNGLHVRGPAQDPSAGTRRRLRHLMEAGDACELRVDSSGHVVFHTLARRAVLAAPRRGAGRGTGGRTK